MIVAAMERRIIKEENEERPPGPFDELKAMRFAIKAATFNDLRLSISKLSGPSHNQRFFA
jgi:hypothetical protein